MVLGGSPLIRPTPSPVTRRCGRRLLHHRPRPQLGSPSGTGTVTALIRTAEASIISPASGGVLSPLSCSCYPWSSSGPSESAGIVGHHLAHRYPGWWAPGE